MDARVSDKTEPSTCAFPSSSQLADRGWHTRPAACTSGCPAFIRHAPGNRTSLETVRNEAMRSKIIASTAFLLPERFIGRKLLRTAPARWRTGRPAFARSTSATSRQRIPARNRTPDQGAGLAEVQSVAGSSGAEPSRTNHALS